MCGATATTLCVPLLDLMPSYPIVHRSAAAEPSTVQIVSQYSVAAAIVLTARRQMLRPTQSVVIWSACNEVECFVTGNANVTGRQMAEATKKWDTTRPFSANQNQLPAPSPDPALHTNDTREYLSAYLDVEGFSHSRIQGPGAAAVYEANKDKNHISSECCSCQTQRGEDTQNESTGLTYPHNLEQANCMQRCMNITYPKYSSAAGSSVGIISGTSGVWTLFDCESQCFSTVKGCVLFDWH